jgi:glucosamine--fructose-6-phosphate aminotransferase (isomerizing)
VYIAARGSSDNAGLYAKYLWGARNRLPVALATPSLFSVYENPPAIHDAFVVGLSQSGQSPDIVSVIEEGRRQGPSPWRSPTTPPRRSPARPIW